MLYPFVRDNFMFSFSMLAPVEQDYFSVCHLLYDTL